ncbi:MAG: BatD family protein [Bacteroidota bacterium]
MYRLSHIALALFLARLFYPANLAAQDKIELTVEAPQVVSLGEVFRLSYTLNAKAESFNGPKIEGFLFNGPMLSTSMSTQIINGQVNQSASYTYNYTLQASQEGTFTIPSASATYKNKTYTCNPVKIEVVKGNAGNQQQNAQTPPNSEIVSSDDLFVRIETDRNQVYKGEQILAVIKIYSRVNLARLGEMKFPSYSGFWNQEIPTSGQVNLERVNYNGRVYNMGIIRKSILVPQQTGMILIDPFEIECFVNVQSKRQRSPFDDIFSSGFFGNYETVTKTISSPPVQVSVKPFPGNPPEGFTGAVGSFSITSGLDKTEAKTNEAVTLKVNIKGKGNIKLIELPKFRFPADLEVYDPKIADNIDSGENGISGSKTFEYLIVPRHAGTYEIPAWSFSYFDPSSGTYKTFNSGPLKLTVSKGENDSEATIISTPGKEDIRIIGQDIRFIKTGDDKLKSTGRQFFGSAEFYFSYILVILLLLFALGYFQYQFKNQNDIEGTRYRKAIAVSRRQLGKARMHLDGGKHELFLEAILKGLWGYLSDKFNLELSVLNRDSVTDLLVSKGVAESIIHDLISTIDSAEYLRYAPPSGEADFRKLLEQSANIIVQLEKLNRR